MNNFSKFGLQEISRKEMKNVKGGGWQVTGSRSGIDVNGQQYVIETMTFFFLGKALWSKDVTTAITSGQQATQQQINNANPYGQLSPR